MRRLVPSLPTAVPGFVALLALLAVLTAGVLPWRTEGPSGSDALLEVARRAPAVMVSYLVAVVACVATLAVHLVRPRSRLASLTVAAIAVLAAVAAMLAVPLPDIRVFGATPDGTFFEFDVPTLRSWGSYLLVAATAISFAATALVGRRP